MSIVDSISTVGDVRQMVSHSEVDCDLRDQSSLECKASNWMAHQLQRYHVNSYVYHTSLHVFQVAGGTGIFARVRHLTAGLRSLSSAGYSMRHLSLLPASPVVNKGYIRHKRVLVGICLILWGEVVSIIVPICP